MGIFATVVLIKKSIKIKNFKVEKWKRPNKRKSLNL